MVRKGTFREDLYFRINGSQISHAPAARAPRGHPADRAPRAGALRGADVPGKPVPAVTDAAMMRLTSYNWPGNVRQLLNVVQNMVVNAVARTR
jgi:DNA-binding NtrC family response regulator